MTGVGMVMDMKEIKIGSRFEKEIIVTEDKLAKAVGSGDVAVYATPMMIALMEEVSASCLAQFLEEGETSVGVEMNTTHSAATPVGMTVKAVAEIVAVDRKKVSFSVLATDEQDTIGTAKHDRFVVNKQKFEQRAAEKIK